jgi:hypothetical protein
MEAKKAECVVVFSLQGWIELMVHPELNTPQDSINPSPGCYYVNHFVRSNVTSMAHPL